MNKRLIKENVIEKLGGVKKACEFFNCEPQAIYQWKDNQLIPKQRQLECLLYRPDIFGENKKEEVA